MILNKSIFTCAFSAFSLLLATASTPIPAQNAEWATAISPHQASEAARVDVQHLLEAFTQMAPGSAVAVLNGYTLAPLGNFEVPEGSRYNSPKARLAKNREVTAAMLTFAEDASEVSPDGLPFPNSVRLPQLLQELASLKSSPRLDALVVGSPLYGDPREPEFAMTSGRYPSDDHLFRTQAETPYGTAGLVDRLEGIRVHLVYDRNVILSTQHEHFLRRWWTLYIESMGGELVTFNANLSTALRRMDANTAAPRHSFEAKDTGKLEMVHLRPPEVTDSIHDEPVSNSPGTLEDATNARDVSIGISWDCLSCDLDLFVRPWPGADVLFYGHARSEQGIFYKDYREGQVDEGNYETVSLSVPVDLRAVQIAINYYNGQAHDTIRGQVRLAMNGQTYSQEFNIEPRLGDEGRTVRELFDQGVSNSLSTRLIDPLSVAGLR